MRHRVWPWAALAAVILLLAWGTLRPSSAAPPDPPLLDLRVGGVDPFRLDKLDPAALPPGPQLLVVQFDRPTGPADRAALQAAGAEVGDYLPDYAYLVRAEGDKVAALRGVPGVRWVGAYRSEWRVDPGVTGRAMAGPVVVERWPSQAAKAGPAPATMQRIAADAATVSRLASDPTVVWVGPATQRHVYNDVARSNRILRVETAWRHGLFGAGQVVGVADSGLDVGDPARLSADFAGRIVATLPLSGTTWNDTVGHGTHVAGSILGNGRLSGGDPPQHRYAGSFAGMAPEASLVVQAFHVDSSSGEISGLPDDLAQLFGPAYAAGARIHSDSWGGPSEDTANPFGSYGPEARAIDRFAWDHPDFLPVFAAGNDGTDGHLLDGDLGDGVVDPDSLSVAATAKNALSVGASESLRTTGGMADAPWLLFGLGSLLGGSGGSFVSEPIASDLVSNNPEGLAAFSSRGPTDDGRIKPDVVAPGTNILSTRSMDPAFDPGLLSWGVYEGNDKYVFNGGTSMATPLTAGSAALVREFYQRQGLAQPSAALVKATLIHHARDLTPGQYGDGATREMGPRPNIAEGWGRVDVGGLFTLAPFRQWVDDHEAGLNTSEAAEYTTANHTLTVTDASLPLRVTLVWTDYPAAAAAARQLVNDLDLEVVAPSGALFPTTPDRLNNVEMAEIPHPETGAWRVVVRGANVPQGPQPYALVVSGGLSASPPTPTPTPYTGPRPYVVYLPEVVRGQ